MKRFLIAALLLLLLFPLASRLDWLLGLRTPEPLPLGPEGIGLIGPATADAGAEIVLRMTGTPPLDLGKPLTTQLGWLMGEDRMYCYLAGPGRPLVPLDVRGELVFGIGGATMQPLLRVQCGEAGSYRILVDWNSGQNQLVSHVILVGGEAPKPNPTPGPTPEPSPGPIPTGERFVLIIHESRDRTAEEATVLTSLRRYLSSQGQCFRIMDEDTATASNWIAPYLAELAKREIKGSAVLVAVPRLNGDQWDHSESFVISADSLPPRSPEALAIIQEALKR